uniref:hypothetical protein n=1 Tax=uncultured Sphingomonas sp. TaxID=158754 RepID=UPI0035C95187
MAATGVGLALGVNIGLVVAAAAGSIGVSAGLLGGALLATIGIAVGTGLEALLPGAKSSQGGSQTKWKADPYAGLPYPMGRTLVSGNIIYRRGHGTNNQYETFVTILGCVTAASIDTTFMNKTTVAFDGGGNATGTYKNQIYQRTQLGAYPEATALQSPVGSPPGWTAQHKLSGLPAAMNTFVYDTKSKTQLTAEPQPGWIGHWAKVYDPRLDSTYPGGSGPCRALNESTYVWSEDPHLHGLTWCLGRWQNGKRVVGIGAPIATVDIPAFVEGANLNRARAWTLGGQVVSRPDTLWNSLKAMLQAGGAQPVLVGGIISCVNRAPRVSLATINSGDIVGDCSFSGTQPRRSRINTIIPMYRSEAHDWEVVSASAVQVAAYVAQDGDERTKEVQYPLVQDVHQVAQLAAYDICDAREAGPGTVPLKPWWLNYRIGDCVTFSPEAGMVQKSIITGRSLDAQSGIVTYQLKTETDSKHAFALGLTGTAPPTASLSYGNDVSAPMPGNWGISGATLTDNGVSIPALLIVGVCDNASAEAVAFDFRPYKASNGVDDGWSSVGIEPPTITQKEIAGVTPSTSYEASVRYRVRGVLGDRLILGPTNAGQLTVDYGVVTGPTRPADNATVGAPAGTMVADTAAEQVVSNISFNATSIIQNSLTIANYQSVLAARTLINGVNVATVQQNFQTQQTATNASTASTIALMGASDAGGTSFILDANSVKTSDGQVLSTRLATTEATLGANTASINTLNQTLIDQTGTTVRAVVQLNVNGQVSGTIATNNGKQSTFDILSSIFRIVDPNSGKPFTVFTYQNGLIRMGSVIVDTLDVNTAVIPGRASSTAQMQGTNSGPTGAFPTTVKTLLTVALIVPVAGWLEMVGAVHQSFTNLTGAPWGYKFQVNGADVVESVFTGSVPGDGVPVLGSYYAATAGTYIITLVGNAHTSTQIQNYAMFVKGFNNTK